MSDFNEVGYIEPNESQNLLYSHEIKEQIDNANRVLINGDMKLIEGSFLGSQVYYARKNIGVSITKGSVVPRFYPGENVPVRWDELPSLIIVPIGNNSYRIDARPAMGKFLGYLDFIAGNTGFLPSGSSATVTIAQTSPQDFVFSFGIPRGDKGAQGSKGAKGEKGELGDPPQISAGSTTIQPPGNDANISIVKSGNKYVFNIALVKGDPGVTPQILDTVTYGDEVDSIEISVTDKSGSTNATLNWDHSDFNPLAVFEASVSM